MLIRDLSERTVALISDPWFLFYHKPKGAVATSTLLLATHRQNHCINIHVISVVNREIVLAINISYIHQYQYTARLCRDRSAVQTRLLAINKTRTNRNTAGAGCARRDVDPRLQLSS